MDSFSQNLISEMEKMKIIDAHSHLPTEKQALALPCDIFNRLFSLYTMINTQTTNLDFDKEWLRNTKVPLKDRWEKFSPIYNFIKETGYVRAARYSAMELYGCDISNETYAYISEKVKEQNKPGFYANILQQKCKIETLINQGDWLSGGIATYIFRGYMGLDEQENFHWVLADLYQRITNSGYEPQTLEEFAHNLIVEDVVKKGFKGIKFVASFHDHGYTRANGECIFQLLRQEKNLEEPEAAILAETLIDALIEACGEYNLVVAIHCGINSWCGGNFYENNPKHLVPFISRYPKTKFDLYHAAIPWIREVAVIANNFPNVYLNLTWAHQISPFMAINSLNEWLDLVPINKIVAFGSDSLTVEKVPGALRLTKENIAIALQERSRLTGLSEKEAIDYCRMWLYDNPKALYKL